MNRDGPDGGRLFVSAEGFDPPLRSVKDRKRPRRWIFVGSVDKQRQINQRPVPFSGSVH